jgi:hypothetical protein
VASGDSTEKPDPVIRASGATHVADVFTKYHGPDAFSLCGVLAQHGVVRAASTGDQVGPRGVVEDTAPPDPSKYAVCDPENL